MMPTTLIICGIMFILALIYIIGCLVAKHEVSIRKKYQEHIDNLVTELFLPATPAVQTPAVNTYTPTANDPDPQEDTVQYQEAKRKMVANIRTYFNQRKINAVIAKIRGPDELAPVNPSAGSYDELSFPTPPSLQRILE